MDSQKTGALLYTLRKEKGLTQLALAEMLHLSDKTISKWERGLGFPDIAMLRDLSRVFGVDVEKILLGDLNKNHTDGGNMKRVKFFVCPSCGNTITATGGDEISCCGRKITPLAAQKPQEGHSVIVEQVEDDYYITFPDHPMTKEHYITFAALVDYDRMLLIKLYPEQSGTVRFPKKSGQFYYHCNQHGLWVERLK